MTEAELEMCIKSGGMAQKATFTVGKFLYHIQQHKDVILIQVTHTPDCLCWSLITDQTVIASSKYDESLKIPLVASRLFDILSNHKKRDSSISITFPTDVTAPDHPLSLEIKISHSALSFGALATIQLLSQNVTFEQRVQKKLNSLNESLQQHQLKLDKTCDETQIELISTKLNELSKRTNMFILTNITVCICCIIIFGVFLSMK